MKHVAKLVLLVAAALLATSMLWAAGAQETTPKTKIPVIGVSKIITHAALDAVEQGIQDHLAKVGIEAKFDFQNANGDISTASSIAQKFKSDKVDMVVGVATPVAQALANVFTDIPVIFSAVTDPLAAGLVPSYGPYDGNVAGVSDMSPVEAQIALLARITGAKTIGNIYASGEDNGVLLNKMAADACKKLGLEFVSSAVSNTAEVMSAAQSIVKRIDAMYIATDNTVISALTSVDDVCSKAKVALMSADPSGVEGLDFLVAWGFDYYKIGLATGRIIEDILANGKKPGQISTVFLTDPADSELWLNLDAAKNLGITLPADLIDAAAYTIENGKKLAK